MSTGVVSGAVALVLEANTGLTPAQVKMALQSSATFMPEAGLVGAGAGSLNAAAADRRGIERPGSADHDNRRRDGSVVGSDDNDCISRPRSKSRVKANEISGEMRFSGGRRFCGGTKSSGVII